MENIFEDAKFGDKFLTRDGKIAIFDSELTIAPYVYLLIEGEHNLIEYDYEGICQIHGASYHNIVSRYQKPIDEDKLDELARKASENFGLFPRLKDALTSYYIAGFKAAYRSAFNNKAMEELVWMLKV